MKDLIARLHHGIPLTALRAARDRRTQAPSLITPIEDDMRKAALLLHEANLIISGLISDQPTFAHREAALNWTRKHS
jgi:hypothetical protein